MKHSKATKRMYAGILQAMKAVIAEEDSSTRVFGDDKLMERILARGVWTNRTITRKVRLEAGIGTAIERKAAHFAREWKASHGK